MKEINCSIVTDLLPLYIDDVVSGETGSFVKEHLSGCEHCRREYEKLSEKAVIADNAFVRLKEAEPLRLFKKQRRRFRALTVSVLLVLILFLTAPLPVRIDRTLDGISWKSGEAETAEECRVTVEGWYYRYLLKDNIFKGDIRFTTAEGTVSYRVPNAALGRSPLFEDRGGAATVYDPALNRMRSLGYLVVRGNFKEIFIHSEEGDFSAPAGSSDEAEELAERLTAEKWW